MLRTEIRIAGYNCLPFATIFPKVNVNAYTRLITRIIYRRIHMRGSRNFTSHCR